MQISKTQNSTITFCKYEAYQYGFAEKFYSRRLEKLGKKCDILVQEVKTPFFLKWLKGESFFKIKVGRKDGYPQLLNGNPHALSESVNAKQLLKDKGAITKAAVRMARELDFIL